MTDSHTVEVTLCSDCLWESRICEHRWCNTWQAQNLVRQQQAIAAAAAHLPKQPVCAEKVCRGGHPPATVICNGRWVCDSCGNEAAQRVYRRQAAMRGGR